MKRITLNEKINELAKQHNETDIKKLKKYLNYIAKRNWEREMQVIENIMNLPKDPVTLETKIENFLRINDTLIEIIEERQKDNDNEERRKKIEEKAHIKIEKLSLEEEINNELVRQQATRALSKTIAFLNALNCKYSLAPQYN